MFPAPQERQAVTKLHAELTQAGYIPRILRRNPKTAEVELELRGTPSEEDVKNANAIVAAFDWSPPVKRPEVDIVADVAALLSSRDRDVLLQVLIARELQRDPRLTKIYAGKDVPTVVSATAPASTKSFMTRARQWWNTPSADSDIAGF